MEKIISNKGKEICINFNNGNVIEENEYYVINYSLEKKVDFVIEIGGLKVKLENNELVLFDNLGTYFVIQSPIIKTDNVAKDGVYDVSLNGGTLHFVLRCEEEECNNLHYVETVIRKVNDNKNELIPDNIGIDENKEDVIYNFETKEIIVRKKISRFIFKLLENYGYRIEYSSFKKLIYREKEYEEEYQMEIKNIYDSYIYLVTDYNNLLSEHRLKRFIYLLLGKEIDESITSNIVNLAFENRGKDYLERAYQMFSYTYKLFMNSNDSKEKMIPFMLMHNELIRSGVPSIIIYYRDYLKFKEINVNSQEEVKEYINKLVEKNKYQERKYYVELGELDYETVKNVIIEDKEILIKDYQIKHINAFGSFIKGEQRIDSDIDLEVYISLDATSDEIEKAKEFIKARYYEKLHRFIDVMVVNEYLTDDERFVTKYSKEIF